MADTGDAVHDSPQMPGLQIELQKAMHSGNVEQTGGCTDAAVRLTNVLKVYTRIRTPVTACHAAVPSLASLILVTLVLLLFVMHELLHQWHPAPA